MKMKIRNFYNDREIFDFARKLRSDLENKGYQNEANELAEVLDTYWTTNSEALGEMRISLKNIRTTVDQVLGEDVLVLVDKAIEDIDDAFNRINNS